MTIATEMSVCTILQKIINDTRKHGKSKRYLDFLEKIHGEVQRDEEFGKVLELGLSFNLNGVPTIKRVEISLAKMEGVIRPLLESRGIVEPRPMPKMEV